MARTPLLPRRPNQTLGVIWGAHPFSISLGYDLATGRILEVFADTPKGGQMQATLADACVLISLALQHGLAPEALQKSLAREPDPALGGTAEIPASPIGAILAVLVAEAAVLQ